MRQVDLDKEYIICSAIWYKDGTENPYHHLKVPTGQVICGYRHGNIIALRATNPARNGGVDSVQGFLTSKGKFVDRYQGMEIAFQSGQVSNSTWRNNGYKGDLSKVDEVIKSIMESEPMDLRPFDQCPMRQMFSEDIY